MLWIWLVEYENTENETRDARINQISAKIKLQANVNYYQITIFNQIVRMPSNIGEHIFLLDQLYQYLSILTMNCLSNT